MMDVSRVLSVLLLLIVICSTASALKNDRGGSSFGSGPNFIQRSRRIALNEYLVPPPPPRHHPVRSGRVVNPQPTETPGYFSKFMDWLNPFRFGPSPSAPLNSPPYPETSFPATPQPHTPPFYLHPAATQPGPSLQPPPGPQPNLPLYPPLNPPPTQFSGPLLPPSLGVHPVLPLNPSSSPPLPIYNAPPPTLHDVKHFLPTLKSNHDAYLSANKGKPCNPCNKFPWIPMQAGELHSDNYPLSPQLSNGYLPPSGQANHDVQHAASHEIRIPDFSHVQIHQNGQQGVVSPLPNPLLYPGPMPPLYKAEPFNQPSQNSHTENVGHFEPPPLLITPSTSHEHRNPEVSNEHFNIRDNLDLTSSGSQINQGHVSVVPQNHESEINTGLADHKESFGTSTFDNQPPISGPSYDQEHRDPPVLKQEHGGIVNQPAQDNQNAVTSFGTSNFESDGFTSQNGDVYHESFGSNSEHNNGLNYLPPNLNPSTSFGTSAFNDQDIGNLNYQYSDDLSPSSSIVKDSHVNTQTSLVSSPSTKENPVHFEESPLLDLSKKSESRTDTHWSPPTTTYIDTGSVAANTVKTTENYRLQTDNILFEDSPSFTRPTESYSSPNTQNVDIFVPSTHVPVDFSESNEDQYTETSTISTGYTNQQDVSYIPPSGQPGFLWPSLLLNAPNSKNQSSKNDALLDPLARWNNSAKEIKNSAQQGSLDSKDANDPRQRQQNVKRNKQVQVIIPYTSEYTPIPFQQSYGDWSVRNSFEGTQPRKVPPSSDTSIDNYVQQESRNEIRLINQLQTQFNFNNSNKLNTRPPIVATENNARTTAIKANNTIDVRRLQKNIDNWTIQEYSKPTTSSTILPSSAHPYLLPSKKIPTEYLTTTEPGDHTHGSNDKNESVKSYSLAGFSFNEVEHEGSASNHVEETQTPLKVIRIESSKSTSSISASTDKSTTVEKSTWDRYSVSISPVNKERVYVVTPQPLPVTPSKNEFVKEKRGGDRENLQQTNKPAINDAQTSKNSLNEFEAIEKAYQVLPQAVNNLAVASTGKEDVPLWGIMEHEEFAALNLDETDDGTVEDVLDGPVLYSGHSKVSRAKR